MPYVLCSVTAAIDVCKQFNPSTLNASAPIELYTDNLTRAYAVTSWRDGVAPVSLQR